MNSNKKTFPGYLRNLQSRGKKKLSLLSQNHSTERNKVSKFFQNSNFFQNSMEIHTKYIFRQGRALCRGYTYNLEDAFGGMV